MELWRAAEQAGQWQKEDFTPYPDVHGNTLFEIIDEHINLPSSIN